MPQSKFSDSVDEIMENLKKQQGEGGRPASDQMVEDILADLGRGSAETWAGKPPKRRRNVQSFLDTPAETPAKENRRAQLKPEPEHEPEPEPEYLPETELEYEPEPEYEPAPRQKARGPKRRAEVPTPPSPPVSAPGSGRITFAQPSEKQPVPEMRQPEPEKRQTAAEKQQPMPEPEEAPSYPVRQPRRPAPTPPSDVKAPNLSATVQFDREFQKFFSESVAVIPDEAPEQHPGFFARFMQRRKDTDEEFYEEEEDELFVPDPEDQQVEPTLMIPSVEKKARPGEEAASGEINLFEGAFEQPTARPAPEQEPEPAKAYEEPAAAYEQPGWTYEAAEPYEQEAGACEETAEFYEPATAYEEAAEPDEQEAEAYEEPAEAFEEDTEPYEQPAEGETPLSLPDEEQAAFDEQTAEEPTIAIPLDDSTGTIPLSPMAGAAETLYGEYEEEEQEEPRRGFCFPKLFGREEPEGDAFEEEEPDRYIEDYEDPEDAADVESHLGRMRAGFVLRTAVSGILSVVLLYLGLAVGESMLPPIPVLDPALSPAAWLLVQLILLAVVCGVNWRVFAKGIPGIWSTPTQDSIPALAGIAALMQLVYGLVEGEAFQPGSVTLFAAPAAILLFFNALGRLLMSGVVLRGFQLVSAGSDHTVAALVQDRELLERITKDMDEPDPCLLANRPTSLVQGYLRRSFSLRASDCAAQKLSWGLFGGALVSALICAFGGKGLGMSITAFAGTLCLGAPLAATLLSAVPAMLMQKSAARVGAVIPGWSAVSQLGRANMVVAGAKDLFPASSVRLHGIKTFEKQRIDLAILYAASILVKGCDTLRDVFMNIIQERTDILYPVENLENHPGLGFTAWVDNNRMIIGNREMMAEQGVEIPSLDYENRYTKGKRQPIYLAVSGRVFAMFLVSYRANSQVAQTLDTLHRQGVSVLLHSDDFCLNTAMAARVYGLSEGCIKVLSRKERKVLEPYTGYTPKAEGCMAHLGSFASFVGGLTAAAGAASGERAASLVQMAGVALSCVMALLLAFTGGIAQLSLAAVLLYGLAWGVLTLALPLFRNY